MINNFSVLNGGIYFGENESKDYSVFQLCSRYFWFKSGNVGSYQSKEISEQSWVAPCTTDHRFYAEKVYNNRKFEI